MSLALAALALVLLLLALAVWRILAPPLTREEALSLFLDAPDRDELLALFGGLSEKELPGMSVLDLITVRPSRQRRPAAAAVGTTSDLLLAPQDPALFAALHDRLRRVLGGPRGRARRPGGSHRSRRAAASSSGDQDGGGDGDGDPPPAPASAARVPLPVLPDLCGRLSLEARPPSVRLSTARSARDTNALGSFVCPRGRTLLSRAASPAQGGSPDVPHQGACT